ncbi:MAG TPA: CreA family protein [Hyphomicrobium sp.]|nr:CreA family protein [Hyphomicrobium sp.]
MFKKTTVWKFLSPDHKIGTYDLDDPEAEGVACHFSAQKKAAGAGQPLLISTSRCARYSAAADFCMLE